jgi:predicted PurR-regulated permease PerM
LRYNIHQLGSINSNGLIDYLTEQVHNLYSKEGLIFNLQKEKAIQLIGSVAKILGNEEIYTTSHLVEVSNKQRTFIKNDEINTNLITNIVGVAEPFSDSPFNDITLSSNALSEGEVVTQFSAKKEGESTIKFIIKDFLVDDQNKLLKTHASTSQFIFKLDNSIDNSPTINFVIPDSKLYQAKEVKLSNRVVVNLTFDAMTFNINMANVPFIEEIMKYINAFNSMQDNGQDFADEIDKFLNQINEVTSNISGSVIHSMTGTFDRLSEIISSKARKYGDKFTSNMLKVNTIIKDTYSDSALDFVAHLLGNFFDQLDSPTLMLQSFADDISNILDPQVDLIAEGITGNNILAYTEYLIRETYNDMKQIVNALTSIASVPILSSFKQSIAIFASDADSITNFFKQFSSSVSSLEQQFSQFEFFPYDKMEKLMHLDVMDLTNLMNKIYRVVGHKLVDELHTTITFISSLDISTEDGIKRLKLVVSGFFSKLVNNIATGIDTQAEQLNDYMENLLPNLISLIPKMIQTLSEMALSITETIISKIGNIFQGILDLSSDYSINTSSQATIDNIDGDGLITINNDEVKTALAAAKELNGNNDFCIELIDKTKSVIYTIDSGMGSIKVFADCVSGKLIHVASFTNVSKYKGYESIARSNPQVYSQNVLQKLNDLAIAEETIKTLSILDRGPK